MSTDSTIDLDGIALHYRTQGAPDAPVLLVMHGWGCTMDTVESIARTAALTHNVISIDFPGFGQSAEPASTWGVEEYAALMEKFLDTLHISRYSLLGHSFGGRVGIVMASRNQGVEKLILVDAAGVKPRRSLRYYWKVYSFKALRHATRIILGARKAEELAETRRRRTASADYLAASPRMRAILSRVVNQDLRHLMPMIKAPTLLIWGENDTATPIRDAKIMEHLIPDSGLVSFPACGHYSFLDNPVQFAAVLSSFLKS